MSLGAYPMMMNHPGYAPAVLADDGPGRIGLGDAHARGTPVRFPPVMVHSDDQREEYEAKGYRVTGAPMPAATPPQQRPGFQKYPMMVGDAVVNDEAEEAAARARLATAPAASAPASSEQLTAALYRIADLEAQIAATQTDPYASVAKIREALDRKAAVFGVAIERNWSIERIILAIDIARETKMGMPPREEHVEVVPIRKKRGPPKGYKRQPKAFSPEQAAVHVPAPQEQAA